MRHRRPLSLIAILLLASCGGGAGGAGQQNPPLPGTDGHPPPPVTPSLSITPAAAQLTAGGASLELTATLTGTTAVIVWSLEGPGSLSSTVGTTVSYLPPSALSTDAVATVTASGGSLSGTAAVTVRAVRIHVAGQVIGVLGNPAPGLTVSIGEQSTVTDEAGRFSLDGVSPPYSVTAFSVASNEAVVYQGLTRTDPTLLWRRPVGPLDRGAQVAGTIDGGIPVSTAGSQTLVLFSSPEAKTQATTLSPEYVVPLSWRGPAATTGSVHVLQLTSPAPGALPTSFPGYGLRTEVTAVDGVTTPGVDVTLTPPAVSSVGGTFTAPPDYAFFAKVVFLGFSDGAFMSLGFDDSPGPSFSYLVPSDVDASVRIIAEASGPGAFVLRRETGIPPGTTDVGLVLPPGAPSLSPMDGAQGVDAQTEFAWGPFPGGVFAIDFVAPGHGPTFHVVTRDTRTTLPLLAALPVPASTQYTWTVTATAPLSSVDEAAGPHPFEPEGPTLLESFSDTLGFITR